MLLAYHSSAKEAVAAVLINEVAWMGTSVSANHEWIELYNSGGAAVDISEWTLTDGVNLVIPLSGTIAPGAYAVLERTSDESAPGAAFLLYTGALVNTGATLTLRRSDGQIEDQVSGGENWQNLGGSNESKETAQYTTQGWGTGTPTPGAANVLNTAGEVSSNEDADDATETKKPTSSSASGAASRQAQAKTVPLITPPTVLALTVKAQGVAYVNQAVAFTAEASGVGDTIIDSLKYSWNFGDMVTASGSKVVHAYQFPGTYIVTLRAQFARHNSSVRHEITVLPVTMTLATTPTGEVQIQNNAVYDVDISGYVIDLGGNRRIFPPDSLIMAKQTLTIPKSAARTFGSTVVLADGAGATVARLPGGAPVSNTAPASPQVAYATAPNTLREAAELSAETSVLPLRETPAFGFRINQGEGTATATAATSTVLAPSGPTSSTDISAPLEVAAMVPIAVATTATVASPKEAPSSWWPYVGLVLVLGGALLGLLLVRPRSSSSQASGPG